MPRVVPSQVVELIDLMFDQLIEQDRLGRDPPLNRGTSVHVEALIAMCSEIPPELISLHGVDYSGYVATLAALRRALRVWELRDEPLRRVPGLRRHPIALLRELLATCPDEAIPAGTTDLPFIDDEPLRDSIRRDLASANSALVNGEWKAATVLAGAGAEALLLWRVNGVPGDNRAKAIESAVAGGALKKRPDGDLNRWTFEELIEVAHNLGTIKKKTRDQLNLTRGFRNLIHPGRAARLEQVCDRGTALSAIAGVELAIRDLTAGPG